MAPKSPSSGGTTSRAGNGCSSPCGACDARPSNQLELPADGLEGTDGLIEVGLRVSRRNLAAHAGLTLRNDRESEAGDEHSLVEQHVAHLNRGCRLTHDDRHDRSIAGERLESSFHRSEEHTSELQSQSNL